MNPLSWHRHHSPLTPLRPPLPWRLWVVPGVVLAALVGLGIAFMGVL